MHQWQQAIGDFESRLPSARRKIVGRVEQTIADTSSVGVGRLRKRLATLLTNTIEEELTPLSDRLEEDLRAAVSTLDASYPEISIEADGAVSVQVRREGYLISGVTQSAALTISGAVMLTTSGIAGASTILAGTVGSAASALASLPIVGSVFGATGTAATGAASGFGAIAMVAGPLGWTLAGMGLLAVPLAWRRAQLRTKDQMFTACP